MQEFILGDCSGDASAVLMEFNTGTQEDGRTRTKCVFARKDKDTGESSQSPEF